MFYFDEFFYDFKKDIFKNRSKKMKIADGILLAIIIIFGMAALILFELKSLNIISIRVTLFVIILLLLAVAVYIILLVKVNKENKNIDFVELHKENVTDKIVDLLNDKKYDFYNVDKIEWLISCCNKKLGEKSDFNKSLAAFKSLSSWFLPLLTLALGIVVQKFSDEDLLYYIAIIIIGFAVFCVFSIILSPVIEYLNCPNKRCLEYLSGELEFIKVDLSNK